ncbi:MAG TPA: hypothetical protein VIH21_09805 [Dehalococcoidia bacterium]|jgi:hypothetical protein
MFERTEQESSRVPRVLTIGRYTDALGRGRPELREAIAREVRVEHLDVSPGMRDSRWMAHSAAEAIRTGVEAVHVFDARLVRAALTLRRRFDVPVSVSISARDAADRSIAGRWMWRSVSRADQAFASDPSTVRDVLARAPRLPVSLTPPFAPRAADTSPRALSAMTRLLDGTAPGRLVIAMPWTAEREHVRWYRDAVVPLLIGNPVTLLLGAPSRRQARIMTGAMGTRKSFRVHVGRIDADIVAAAARCADAFVVTGTPHATPGIEDLLLAVATARVPLVASGGVQSGVLRHERNALTVEPGDSFGLVATLNKLLALPAEQRHYLGLDFAADASESFDARATAAAYAERFYSLVGRPLIPLELRAA